MDNIDNDKRYELFLQLFRKNENYLFGFVLKLLPHFTIAEEIMQETLLTMWQKFDEFEEGTNFAAWSRQIARYKVMTFLHKNKRRSIVHFNDEILDDIEADAPPKKNESIYFEALHCCIDKLQGKSREIINLHYVKNMKINQIASLWGVSGRSLYRQMAKVHLALQKCIEKTVAAWELTNE